MKHVRQNGVLNGFGTGGQEKTETKYVEKDAAILKIEEYADRLQMVNWKENPGVPYKAYALNWCINTIRDLPPADVRPVVRGEWKSKNTDALTLLDVRTCSVCGLKKVFITNFCPSCGADMRGGDVDG